MEKALQTPFFLLDQLQEEHVILIGKITFDFSKVEFLLIEIITKGFHISTKAGRIIFSIMTVHDRIKVIRKLICTDEWIKDNKLRIEIEKFIKNVDKYSKLRNENAHSIYGFDIGDPNFYRIKVREYSETYKPKTDIVDISNIRTISQEIYKLISDAVSIIQRLDTLPEIA
jgi:hypothetical protein